MKVFLSWSGEISRSVAELLQEWIPDVINIIQPWVSSEDIRGGDRWLSKLLEQLDESDFGILCCTAEAVTSAWLLFEAGALAKHLNSRVVPLLIDIRVEDLPDPLKNFQARAISESGLKALVEDINSALAAANFNPLDSARLDRAFNRTWPALKDNITNLGIGISGPTGPTDENNMGALDLVIGHEDSWAELNAPILEWQRIMEEIQNKTSIYTEPLTKETETRRRREIVRKLASEYRELHSALARSNSHYQAGLRNLKMILPRFMSYGWQHFD